LKFFSDESGALLEWRPSCRWRKEKEKQEKEKEKES